MYMRRTIVSISVAGVMVAAVAGQALGADVYKGIAKFTNAKGNRTSAPVTITIDQPTPDADRTALADKVRSNPASAREVLAGQKEIGSIEAVDRRVPIRYAYVVPGGEGKLITVISDESLGYIGGDKKDAKSKEGYDLTYAMVQVNASGKGSGEMAPACKVKWMESGAPAVEDYGKQVVWLDDVETVTQR